MALFVLLLIHADSKTPCLPISFQSQLIKHDIRNASAADIFASMLRRSWGYLCSRVALTQGLGAHVVSSHVPALSEVGTSGRNKAAGPVQERVLPAFQPSCSPASPRQRPSWVARAARLSHQLNLRSVLGLNPEQR